MANDTARRDLRRWVFERGSQAFGAPAPPPCGLGGPGCSHAALMPPRKPSLPSTAVMGERYAGAAPIAKGAVLTCYRRQTSRFDLNDAGPGE
jgi:hypothetical protein